MNQVHDSDGDSSHSEDPESMVTCYQCNNAQFPLSAFYEHCQSVHNGKLPYPKLKVEEQEEQLEDAEALRHAIQCRHKSFQEIGLYVIQCLFSQMDARNHEQIIFITACPFQNCQFVFFTRVIVASLDGPKILVEHLFKEHKNSQDAWPLHAKEFFYGQESKFDRHVNELSAAFINFCIKGVDKAPPFFRCLRRGDGLQQVGEERKCNPVIQPIAQSSGEPPALPQNQCENAATCSSASGNNGIPTASPLPTAETVQSMTDPQYNPITSRTIGVQVSRLDGSVYFVALDGGIYLDPTAANHYNNLGSLVLRFPNTHP